MDHEAVPVAKVALPVYDYLQAVTPHRWNPALHSSDVITAQHPWNWSVLALGQLSNPPPLQPCVRDSKNNMLTRLPKHSIFPSDAGVV